MGRIAELLHRHGVEFIVIGGQAETIMGSPRITYDVDICYQRTKENLIRLAQALAEIHPKLRGAPADLPFQLDAKTLEMGMNFTLATDIVDLDLLGYVEPIGHYEDVKKNAELFPAFNMNLVSIGLDDLLRIKLHLNRVKDQESILQLKAIKRIREGLTGNA